MFKKLSVALVLSLALLVGCASQKPEDVVREGIVSELESIKNEDEKLFSDLSSGFEALGLNEFGIDSITFAKSYFDGFDYEIHSVEVKDDTAIAQITLNLKSFSEYTDLVMKESEKLSSDPEILKLSEEDLYKKIGEIVMSSIDKTSLKKTDKFEVEYKLKDKTWTPADNLEEVVTKAMLSN